MTHYRDIKYENSHDDEWHSNKQKSNKQKAIIYFFPNGNTAVIVNDKQSPEHQRSWFLKYIDFLIKRGNIDVLNSEYNMPDGSKAKLIKLKKGYNWKITQEGINDSL